MLANDRNVSRHAQNWAKRPLFWPGKLFPCSFPSRFFLFNYTPPFGPDLADSWALRSENWPHCFHNECTGRSWVQYCIIIAPSLDRVLSVCTQFLPNSIHSIYFVSLTRSRYFFCEKKKQWETKRKIGPRIERMGRWGLGLGMSNYWNLNERRRWSLTSPSPSETMMEKLELQSWGYIWSPV